MARSVFGKDGFFSGGDEDGLRGLAYMLELVKRYTAGGEGLDLGRRGAVAARGKGRDGDVVGRDLPRPRWQGLEGHRIDGAGPSAGGSEAASLRDAAGFQEIPHIGHQGGSSICLRNIRRIPMPPGSLHAVGLLQGRGRSLRRSTGAAAPRSAHSTYKDPRVLAAAKVGPGTTRHFPATEWTIDNAFGSGTQLPAWVEIANHIVPGELGKLLAGQGTPEQCMAAIKDALDRLAAPFRSSNRPRALSPDDCAAASYLLVLRDG